MDGMELDARLAAVGTAAGQCATLADIGCDHGYLSVSMLLDGKADRAVLTDINRYPLARARENAIKYSVIERCDLRQGPGLVPVKPGECDVACICGMGGDTIIGILSDSPDVARKFRRIVLQPQTHAADVRAYLSENGFETILDSYASVGAIHYQVVTAVFTGKARALDPGLAAFPAEPAMRGDSAYQAFLRFHLGLNEKIIGQIRGGGATAASADGLAKAQWTVRLIAERLGLYENQGDH
jgi:tRNA A22 N-methylase